MLLRKIGSAIRLTFRAAGNDDMALAELRARTYPHLYKLVFWMRKKKDKGAARLFVDLGSNTGQGFSYFKNLFSVEDYTYHFFEPNPFCRAKLNETLAKESFPKGRKVFPHAAWIRDEQLRFYGVAETGDQLTQGGSLVNEHNRILYEADEESALIVDAIDFGAYLAEMQEIYDDIVIKMDIEGAELDVLEDLWSRPNFFVKNVLMFVEWHAIYRAGADRIAAEARQNRIIAATPANVEIHRWY